LKKKTTDHWPTFDASLLQDVSAAFLRRRKSIKCRFGLWCERGGWLGCVPAIVFAPAGAGL
jgi:hypothetical protein